MQFIGLGAVLLLLAGFLLFLAVRRVLWGTEWVMPWLRGSAGLLVIALALFFVLLATDLMSYRLQDNDKNIVSISIEEVAGATGFQVRVISEQQTDSFQLEGDLWGMDVRYIRWRGLADLLGMQPGYRLERISGRFLSLEKQNSAEHPEQELDRSKTPVDLWQWVQNRGGRWLLMETRRLRVNFIPMTDGARYSVRWLPTGLDVKPINEQAEQAMADWLQ